MMQNTGHISLPEFNRSSMFYPRNVGWFTKRDGTMNFGYEEFL